MSRFSTFQIVSNNSKIAIQKHYRDEIVGTHIRVGQFSYLFRVQKCLNTTHIWRFDNIHRIHVRILQASLNPRFSSSKISIRNNNKTLKSISVQVSRLNKRLALYPLSVCFIIKNNNVTYIWVWQWIFYYLILIRIFEEEW